ncbi:hypothetical protein Trydic_g6247 [Trypoxylus dichotomus]
MNKRRQFADIGSNTSKVVNVNNKERDGAPEKFQNIIDPCQTLEGLSATLDVDASTDGKRLHAFGMVQKGHTSRKKGVLKGAWSRAKYCFNNKKESAFCIDHHRR